MNTIQSLQAEITVLSEQYKFYHDAYIRLSETEENTDEEYSCLHVEGDKILQRLWALRDLLEIEEARDK